MKAKLIIVAVLLLAAIGGFSGYKYYNTVYLPKKRLDKAVKNQADIIERIRPDTKESSVKASGTFLNTDGIPENVGAEPLNISDASNDPLVLCENVNDDIVGWITIPDTNIDLPIVQGEDNDLYLHNGVDGQYNYELGCPFLDYRCSSDFSGLDSIVYAHNMENRGMFADVTLFGERSFLETHKQGTLTLKDGEHEVNFFAYLSVSSTSPVYNTVFVSQNECSEYIDLLFNTADHTSFFTAEELKERPELHLLLLSTCTFETEDSRGVLAGIIE